jgi:hypothetical protein
MPLACILGMGMGEPTGRLSRCPLRRAPAVFSGGGSLRNPDDRERLLRECGISFLASRERVSTNAARSALMSGALESRRRADVRPRLSAEKRREDSSARIADALRAGESRDRADDLPVFFSRYQVEIRTLVNRRSFSPGRIRFIAHRALVHPNSTIPLTERGYGSLVGV